MRLIDADALIERLIFLRKQAGYGMIATGIETAITEINDARTIEFISKKIKK